MTKQQNELSIVDLPKEGFNKYFKKEIKPIFTRKEEMLKIVFIVLWIVFFFLVFMVFYMQRETNNSMWFDLHKLGLSYSHYEIFSLIILAMIIYCLRLASIFLKKRIFNIFLAKTLKEKLFKAINFEYYSGCFDLQEFQPVWDFFNLKKTNREIIFGKLSNRPFFIMLYEEDKDNMAILLGAKTNKPFTEDIILKEKKDAPSIHSIDKKLSSPKILLQDFFDISPKGNSEEGSFFSKAFITKLLEYKKKKDAKISILFSQKYSKEKNVYFCLSVKSLYWDYLNRYGMSEVFNHHKYLSAFLKEVDRLLDIIQAL